MKVRNELKERKHMPSRPLTEIECRSISDSLKCPMSKCLFILGVRTGFRISELLSLTTSDVTLDKIVLTNIMVKRRNMKGKQSSRSVILHEEARQALSEYLMPLNLGAKERIFPISRFVAHRIIRKACKEAGIEGRISTHSMRKNFAMRIYEKTNKDVVATQRALGHASLASTTKYLNVGQDIIDKAILES